MIEQHTIDGRPASVAYMHDDFTPADSGRFAFAKVLFDDGEMLLLTNEDYDHEHDAEAFNRHRQKRTNLPHPEAEAFNRHRTKQGANAEVIDGNAEAGAWSKHRARHLAPYMLAPDEATELIETSGVVAPEHVPIKLQLVAWAKAVVVLDASEVLVRDMIERELLGLDIPGGLPLGKIMQITQQLVEKIRIIREDAIKVAFRLLRTRLGNAPILDHTLAEWAQSFARQDIKAIDAAIQNGLVAGLDNAEIARKVVGTMGLNGVDGVTEYTRHKVAHLGRASIREQLQRQKELDLSA